MADATPPAPTTRTTPDGIQLPDGFSTLVTIAYDTDICFWEKEVTPPGLDGGDAIEQTTMHNTSLRTFRARSLSTMTEMSISAAYDPDAYDEILAAINEETTITVTFSDSSTLAFYGYLKTFTPGALVEGEQPLADIVIQPTNYDPTNHVEADFVMTEVEGT